MFDLEFEKTESQHETFKVKRTNVNFQNSYIYSPVLFKFGVHELVTYDIFYSLGITRVRDASEWRPLSDTLLAFHFKQSQEEFTNNVTRVNLAASFAAFGSYLALILRFTYYLIGEF